MLPDSSPRPAVEPIVRTRVRAVAFGQIAPRDPGPQHVKYCIYDPSIVRARALPTLRHQRLENRPFLIAEIESHDPPPPAVNHDPCCFSVNYAGTDPTTSSTTAYCSLRPSLALRPPTRPRTARCGSVMRAWASRSEHPHEAGGSRLESSTNLPGSEIGTSGFSFAGCRRANARPASEIESLIVRNERLADRRHLHTRPTM
jgi:hypothetical protein